MAALEGFVPSCPAGDIEVTAGMVNGKHVAGATLDCAALNDSDPAYVLVKDIETDTPSLLVCDANATTPAITWPDGAVVVASCNVVVGVASAPKYTGRGMDKPASG